MTGARAEATRLEDELRALGSPERAVGSKKYLKSDLEFFGASMGPLRAVITSFAREHKDMSHDGLVELAEALWDAPVFERRIAAVVLLQSYPKLLGVHDLELVERLVRGSETWALVDPLSTDVAGGIVAGAPDEARPILDRWARDEDFWVRRSALLVHLRSLRDGGDPGEFLAYADAMLDEKEFFIRKAIGWVLREASKEQPDVVYEWIAPRTHRASGVTMREAVKYLGDERASELMNAYKEKRPASTE